VLGVFCTWTKIGPATLNGTEGPNDGWLVVIVAVLALGWARMMGRCLPSGAIGALGALGAGLVICWTAIESWVDNKRVLDASVGYGLLLSLTGGAALALAAVLRCVYLLRSSRRQERTAATSERRAPTSSP
jgi:hypothetical protein